MRYSCTILLLGIGVLSFALTGCASFREIFSAPPPKEKPPEKRSRADADAASSGERNRAWRDPVAEMFQIKSGRKEYFKDGGLSDQERRMLQESMKEDHSTDAAIREIRNDYRNRRRKVKDDVFGPNPFR